MIIGGVVVNFRRVLPRSALVALGGKLHLNGGTLESFPMEVPHGSLGSRLMLEFL